MFEKYKNVKIMNDPLNSFKILVFLFFSEECKPNDYVVTDLGLFCLSIKTKKLANF